MPLMPEIYTVLQSLPLGMQAAYLRSMKDAADQLSKVTSLKLVISKPSKPITSQPPPLINRNNLGSCKPWRGADRRVYDNPALIGRLPIDRYDF